MGPSGHQGIVIFTVTSKDGKWECRAQANGTNLGVTPEYGLKPTCSNTAHDTYVLYADLVETHIAEERAAAAEIGSNNKEADHQLGNAYSGMRGAASIVKSKGGDAGTVGDMTGASGLDAHAEKQDLTQRRVARRRWTTSPPRSSLRRRRSLGSLGSRRRSLWSDLRI
jgi:hypothetical protein